MVKFWINFKYIFRGICWQIRAREDLRMTARCSRLPYLDRWNHCHSVKRGKMQKEQAAAAAAKSLQLCPTLCDPIDGSPPGSPVPGILQARTLEWIAISSSSAWKWKVKVKSLSRVRLLSTPWTAAYQAPPSMGFSRQEYWSGLPLPSPKNKLGSRLRLFHTSKCLKSESNLWTQRGKERVERMERAAWKQIHYHM